jgi:hypothetical protein
MELLKFVLPAALVAILALLVGFAFAGRNLRETLLGSDSDGWQPLGLGGFLLVVGILVPDFTTSNILIGLGILFGLFGALILADNRMTNTLTSPLLGAIYAVLTFLAYRWGATATGAFAFDSRSLVALVLPAFGASVVLTLTVVALMSQSLKDRLSEDIGGGAFLVLGIVLLVGSAFARLNPALMVATAASGGLMTALGTLVVMNNETSDRWMAKSKILLYVPVALGLLYLARQLY